MTRTFSGHWRRLIAGCLAVLVAAFAVPALVRAPDLDENRSLAPPPEPPRGLQALAAWPRAADLYVADHFPPRALLIAALNALRLRLGVSGSRRVIVGRDGWLFYDDGSHLGPSRGVPVMSDARVRVWLSGLAGRSEALRARGIAYLVLAAPDKESIYPARAPDWFRLDPDRPAMRLRRLAERSGAGELIYPADPLTRAARAGSPVYTPYETHWTGLGAYLAYAELMRRLQALGLSREGPRPMEAFARVGEGGPDAPRNLALMLGVASFVRADYPQLDDPAAEARLRTVYLTDEVNWTKPHVIDTGMPDKPVLLLMMDSFSQALVPFLYGDFSRIVVAHNQDGPWREDLIARFQPDVVVTEVVESGLPYVVAEGPQASPAELARIDAALKGAPPPGGPQPPVRFALAQRRRPLEPLQGRGFRTLAGGPGDDHLVGGDEPDAIIGQRGDDTLEGRGGPDVLRGGRGNDSISGGPGDDWISGDRGVDTLSGGPGADTFHLSDTSDLDLVVDFSAAEGDRVEIEPGLAWRVRQVGPDTVIELPHARMVLKGVKAASLPRRAIGDR